LELPGVTWPLMTWPIVAIFELLMTLEGF